MATLGAGIGAVFFAIIVSTVMDGNSFGPLLGPSSLVMVMFGTIGASITGFEMEDLKRLPAAVKVALGSTPPDPGASVTLLAELSDIARKEGVLALEARLEGIEDDFIRGGIQLIVDGIDGDQIQEVLEINLAASGERHKKMIDLFDKLVATAPVMGMIGTVIGLVNMLQNLSSPEQLGIGMSLALLTTLYGVFFANIIFGPIGAKLTNLNKAELSARDMTIDGILTVQAGASPRMLVERLETYLPPEERVGYKQRLGQAA